MSNIKVVYTNSSSPTEVTDCIQAQESGGRATSKLDGNGVRVKKLGNIDTLSLSFKVGSPGAIETHRITSSNDFRMVDKIEVTDRGQTTNYGRCGCDNVRNRDDAVVFEFAFAPINR